MLHSLHEVSQQYNIMLILLSLKTNNNYNWVFFFFLVFFHFSKYDPLRDFFYTHCNKLSNSISKVISFCNKTYYKITFNILMLKIYL